MRKALWLQCCRLNTDILSMRGVVMSGLWRYLGGGDPNDTYDRWAESSGPPVTPFEDKWRDRLQKVEEVMAFCAGLGIDPKTLAEAWEREDLQFENYSFVEFQRRGLRRWNINKAGTRNVVYLTICPTEKMVYVTTPTEFMVMVATTLGVDGGWRWGNLRYADVDLMKEDYWRWAGL